MHWIIVWSFLGMTADPLTERAAQVVALIQPEPTVDSGLFSADFLRALPPAKMREIVKKIAQDQGAVERHRAVQRTGPFAGNFLIEFAKGTEMDLSLTLGASPPHPVISLFFKAARPKVASFSALVERLKELPGRVSFAVRRIDGEPTTIAELNPDEALAIGSAFKLYLLALLVEDQVDWTQILRLQPENRSLPSGRLHDWPIGAPLTLHSLAVDMISISDNTATDHLLAQLGRRRVEKSLTRFGNLNVQRNQPFLATLEMFKLKTDGPLRDRYLKASDAEKRRLLSEEVRRMPRDRVAPNSMPLAIDTLEWFASANDLCRLLKWLHEANDATALAILSVNPGLPRADRFRYQGYKGGSEPGVLNMTWLIRSAASRTYSVAASWNNTAATIDNAQFTGLMQAALNLLAEQDTK